MKFEHLVEINDPLNPLIDPLTRDQLWAGLKLHAEDPVPFVLGLDQCTIAERTADGLKRELRFGRVPVRDTVTFRPNAQVHYRSEGSPEVPAGTRTVTIEEPRPGELYVRFVYETSPQGQDLVPREYRKVMEQAYVEADIDVIGQIRRLAEDGKLA